MMTESFDTSIAEISIRDVILFLWNKKITIVAVTILCTAFALLIALTTTPEFSAEAKFTVRSSAAQSSQISGIAALAGIQIGGGQGADPSNYLDLVIQDEGFVQKIIDRKWLYKNDSLDLVAIWKMKPDTTKPDWEFRFKKATIEAVRGSKRIKLVKNDKSGILTLTTLFPDPQLTYGVCNYVISLLGEYLLNSAQSRAKAKRIFIEGRIAEAKQELETSENALASFRERNIVTSSPKVSTEEMRLTRQVAINQEIYLELEKQYEMAQIEEKNDQARIEMIKEPEIPVYCVKPKKKMLVVMGFFAGIFCGILAAAAQQWYVLNFGTGYRKRMSRTPGEE